MKINRSWYNKFLFYAVLIAVIWFLSKNIDAIRGFNFVVKWQFIAAALFVILFAFLLMFFVWIIISSSFGLKGPLIKAAYTYYKSLLGKYVPGKIFILLVRVNAYQGTSKEKVAVATVVEEISLFASSCLLIIIGLSTVDLSGCHYINWFGYSGLFFLIALLYPPVLMPIVNFLFKVIKREPVTEFPNFRKFILFVMMHSIVWIFLGASFFLTFKALTNIAPSNFFIVTGAFCAARSIGMLAFFAPSGIGVREAILVLILLPFIPKEVLIISVFLFRLFWIFGDLFFVALSFILTNKFNKINYESVYSNTML